MRIDEVETVVDNDLVLLLRNLVAQANSKQQPSFLNWKALNNLLQNINENPYDYYSFEKQHSISPAIKKLVYKFDDRGVELKTYGTDPKKSKDGSETNISKMAKNAAKRRIG